MTPSQPMADRRLSLSPADWSFRNATRRSRWNPAQVPGCVHRDLLRLGQIPDPFFGTNELELQWIEECDWEYLCQFEVPDSLWAEDVIELCADGLDTVALVTLNGHRVARTDNMFTAHHWPVKRWLRPGRNELHILFRSAMDYIRTTRTGWVPPKEFNDPVGRSQRIRKQQCQFGWDWAPRLVTAGVWRDIFLRGWSANRIEHVHVRQEHGPGAAVKLSFAAQLARADAAASFSVEVSLRGERVAAADGLDVTLRRPELWWPNGQGDQPLYDVAVILRDRNGAERDRWQRRIGLRTIALDRQPDKWGESFRFLINGRPVFIKGANWIPAHTFVAGLTRKDYARDLTSAASAHMNCMRVWGGGVYEHESFYDLCDELGLLVWQDFMFACSLYPGDRDFLRTLREEADGQTKRLQHRACLMMWCGNNESGWLNWDALKKPALRRDYEAVFHRLLPETVRANDGVTPYWPSSQWRGGWKTKEANSHQRGEERGDTHFWDVWFARHPVKDYEKYAFRFVSEFGMQSYPSPETQATFCPPGDSNLFGPAMENHQKCRAGNQVVFDYVSRRYRLPRGQEELIYLSQINQAYCMQTAIEHHRRTMPRCMGSIYWQINDCWPVASWSSIEFSGRWKALHYHARRFFAPLLVSAHVPGDEVTTIGNYRASTVDAVHLYTVSDAPGRTAARLSWELRDFSGVVHEAGAAKVVLRGGESRRQKTLHLLPQLKRLGRDRVYLRIALEVAGRCVSEESVLLAPPRFLALPAAKTRVRFKRVSPTAVELTLAAAVFQHRVAFHFTGLNYTASDNYFDLHPGVTKRVTVEFPVPVNLADLRRRWAVLSLAETYSHT